MPRKPIWNSILWQGRDLKQLKGGPWWKVRGATEERRGAESEEGTEEFKESGKEQRRRPVEQPSRRPRRRDAIRPATLLEKRGIHRGSVCDGPIRCGPYTNPTGAGSAPDPHSEETNPEFHPVAGAASRAAERWAVVESTERNGGAESEEGTEEFKESEKEQRRRPVEPPSRRPRRHDAIRPATLLEKHGIHRCV
ncbi:hypothetical protein NDU88_006711 [Pleurodeles waltl]|uniref:Uncharacterized protein n=1 Tax=Pleurodeles waltl TaxID=8319 RepID=A0AAV7SQB6_PLEWA|nr:hypothetical protein NDU88_006711 [Pleurodeles waltl]